jgi:AmmeMemoRadiSam system protein A
MMADVYLPPGSQKRLIEIARQTLEGIIRRCPCRDVNHVDPYLENTDFGAFVTLFNQDELRGCIGTCTPSKPLREIVVEMTEAAATRDRRVRPVRAAELPQIHIDISVLSPLLRSPEPLALKIGQHGLHVTCGRKRGVFLPQVAVEYGWDIKTFLEQTCLKANLPKDAWGSAETVVSSFTALIIEEGK